MTNIYYRMDDDVCAEGRWFLDGLSDNTGRELDSRDLTYGVPIELGPPLRLSLPDENTFVDVAQPLKVSLRKQGRAMDFTFADFDMPVATLPVAELLGMIAGTDIQRIPVTVEGQEAAYEIINVVSRVDCIDCKRSEIEWWTESDDRPDKTGKPRMITRLVIDASCVGEQQIFHPEGWDVAVIVSDVMKNVLENAKVSGVTFQRVS